MAGTIKGIIVEIGGDTSGLQKALKNVNSATSSLTKELKGVNSLLKLDPSNTELVSQKQKILAQNIEETSDKLEILKQTQKEADEAIKNGTKISDENYRNLQREIVNTENKLKDLKVEASSWTTAGRAIEEYGDKIKSLGNKLDDVGNKLTTRLTLPIATGFTLMAKSAIESETAIQQVDKIYGEASDTIKDFAENTALSFNMSSADAYKYAQIYGNLIQTITDDQAENAKYTQDLLKASSVIASATGRTMEDVMDRIRSGLLGNTEAIEDLGVNVNVALLETTDAFRQFAGDKSWNQLDFQTQQQIRLFGILEQTTKKYGDEVNQNTASSIQKLTAKTKNLTNDLGKKLLPTVNDILEIANDLVDKFADLSDEEQENIIKMGLMVAAAGPLIKIAGTGITLAGKVTKGIGLFSQAVAVAANKTTSTNQSVNNLAKGLKSIVSPAGIVTGTLTGVAIAVELIHQNIEKELESTTELIQKLNSETEARRSSLETIREQRDAQLAEIDNVAILKNELTQLVDENGRVKEGYESRTQFILNELNEALGTEYELNNNIIDSYSDMCASIDELILKKKAQIILEASEDEYREAIQNKTKAMENYLDTQDELSEATAEYNKLLEDRSRGWIGSEYSLVEGSLRLKEYGEKIKELNSSLGEQEQLLVDYNNNIASYEEKSQLMLEGGIENYKKIEASVGKTQATITQNANEELNKRIQNQIAANNQMQGLYNLEVQMNQNAQDSIYATNLEEGQKQLELLAEELVSRTSTIGNLGTEEIEAWKTLAQNSYDVYEQVLSQMPVEVQEQIQEMTGVLIADTTLGTESQNLAKEMKDSFDENSDGQDSGENFIEGIQNGIEYAMGGLLNSVWELGKKILASFNGSLDEHSPSKLAEKSGINFVQGAINGINSKEKEALNLASRLGSGLIEKFNKSFNGNYLNSNLANATLSSRVIDSTKTIFTTPTLNIYTQDELTPAKLNIIIDTVNRRLGSQY